MMCLRFAGQKYCVKRSLLTTAVVIFYEPWASGVSCHQRHRSRHRYTKPNCTPATAAATRLSPLGGQQSRGIRQARLLEACFAYLVKNGMMARMTIKIAGLKPPEEPPRAWSTTWVFLL